jgi:hypothetical protein
MGEASGFGPLGEFDMRRACPKPPRVLVYVVIDFMANGLLHVVIKIYVSDAKDTVWHSNILNRLQHRRVQIN